MFKFLNIVKANSRITELETQNEDLKKLNEDLTKDVESLKQREATYSLATQDWATEKEALIEGHEEAIKALTEKHQQELENLRLTVKSEQASASVKAAEIVASLGVEPEAVKVKESELQPKTVSRFKVVSHLPK